MFVLLYRVHIGQPFDNLDRYDHLALQVEFPPPRVQVVGTLTAWTRPPFLRTFVEYYVSQRVHCRLYTDMQPQVVIQGVSKIDGTH